MLAEVIGGDDVRVSQLRDGAGFLLETADGAGVGHATDEDCLERDDPVECDLTCAVDDTHSAPADDVFDDIAGDDLARLLECLDGVELDGIEEALFDGELCRIETFVH